MTARAWLAALLLACVLGCGARPKTPAEVKTCRDAVREEFHKRSEDCDTEGCIDSQTAKELVELKGCR